MTTLRLLSSAKLFRELEVVRGRACVLLGQVLHERAVVNLVELLSDLMNPVRILFLVEAQIKELALDLINPRA